MCDMAHISGLVASEIVNNPFKYCDIITTTTHKSLAGPRSGMIFFKKEEKLNLENRINFAVFPSLQGGPHNNAIAGVCTQLLKVATPAFKEYSVQVVKNAQTLAKTLMDKGHKLATNGTENHLILWDLRPHGLTGNKVELLCDTCSLTLNKNSINGDKSAFSPGGVRLGSPALTSRGFKEADFVKVGIYLDRMIQICLAIQGGKKMKLVDFKKGMVDNAEIAALRKDVEAFATQFPMPGVDLPK